MTAWFRTLSGAVALIAGCLLVGSCGGGGDGSEALDSNGTDGTAPPASTSVSGVAIDGYLHQARVFLDVNGNGRFDTGEPESLTDAQGRFTLTASTSQAASHAIAAMGVPGLTIDQDDPGKALPGPIWLIAPVGRPGVVSPLTTLVAARMAGGATLDSAKAVVQQDLGLGSVDVMKDFVAEGNKDPGYAEAHKLAGAIAEILIEIERESTTSTTLLNKLAALDSRIGELIVPNLAPIKAAPSVAGARALVVALMEEAQRIYSTGGTLLGLNGDGLVLANGTDTVSPDRGATTFVFASRQAAGSPYNVTVQAHPGGQNCQVAAGAGTVPSRNVTDIAVTCTNTSGVLSGVITGLSTSGLVLQNGSEELPIPTGATTFRFSAPIAVGTSYSVFVKTQPIGKTCSVANGAGNMPTTGVSGVQVTCSANAYQVGGTVTNLIGAGLKLRNGAEVLGVPAGSATFTMSLPVAFGGSYSIAVEAQPVGQVCSAANSSGTMGAGSVTSVQITCASNMYTLGGTISGLKTDGLVLQNGSESLTVAAGSSSFNFRSPIAFGGTYAVTISQQPNRYSCSLENSSGTMGGANVASVHVTCSAYRYRLVDLGTLPGCSYSRATAMSSDGKVAGDSCAQLNRSRAFLYANGRMQNLGVIGADETSESSATAVNNAGVVVGTSTGDTRGFIWNGRMERFPAGVPAGTFPGFTAVTEIFPAAINDDGVVVGSLVGLQPQPVYPGTRAFVYQSGGLRYLGNSADGQTMFGAYSINREGHVVARGDFIDPEPSPYVPYVALFDLRSGAPGVVVGGFMHACSPRVSNADAILICSGKGYPPATSVIGGTARTNIPPLVPEGYVAGNGINRWGEVVGVAGTKNSGFSDGFIYREGETLALDDLLDSSADGWHVVSAADTNDDGLIAATAKYKAGNDRAVLLVPIR